MTKTKPKISKTEIIADATINLDRRGNVVIYVRDYAQVEKWAMELNLVKKSFNGWFELLDAMTEISE